MIVFKVQGGKVVAEVEGVTGPACEAKLQAIMLKAGLQTEGDTHRKPEFYQEETVDAAVKVV